MLTTTLNEIKSKSPCTTGWKKLLEHLGKSKADSEPLGFDVILKSNGLNDAFWAMRVLDGEQPKQAKLFICDIAERALKHVPEGENRPAIATATARKFINGDCSIEELRTAKQDAYTASYTAASYTASAASAAAAAAADAAYAAYATEAAFVAAGVSNGKQERQEQEKMFIEFINKF